ncbi:spondin domain-containing protein [Pseudoalteromonas prydzensis]|uniref:spondin domain-containing protein n=1 Tax=Pseudoalteromonas prydzensis TaxID=182141 RepID=UPI0007E50E29|nr:spondin domain-containing protein [Pseudoalteromonas prydzensis]MBE0377625.1 hypothetical protein [Pseudoalteromonas prydzensis ACAM 620]
MNLNLKKITFASVIISGTLALVACNDNDKDDVMIPPPPPAMVSYDVTVVNLTEGQLLSPIAAVLHTTGELWELGQPASVALEKLAESGDSQDLVAQDFVMSSASADDPTMPGENEMLTLSIEEQANIKLSVASMLVNTNDAFIGLNSIELSNLAIGESLTFTTFAYDAGTEANTESASTVPGPIVGGEGYNAIRDDVRDMVLMHAGVVSSADGLASSALSQAQRFDNPVAKVLITRTE